ncbi:MAG: hypothetical protein ABGZ17_03790 [Planctomycetaceae bacterium]
MTFAFHHPRIWVVTLLANAILGCTGKYAVRVSDQGLPDYKRLLITYEQDALTDSARITPVVSEIETGIDSPSGQPLRLRIEYPHPESRAGYGQATLILGRVNPSETQAAWWQGRDLTTPEMLAESTRRVQAEPDPQPASDSNAGLQLWQLDISRQRLDSLLIACADSGFFDDSAERVTGDTRLVFEIDHGKTAKTWTSHSALDNIAREVYTSGSLGNLE